MAQATTGQTPSYRLSIHVRALSSWGALPAGVQQSFKGLLAECATRRRPSEHQKAQLMRNGSGVFRLRHGDYRVLCDKHCGELRVLHVGPRETVYDEFGVAVARSKDQ